MFQTALHSGQTGRICDAVEKRERHLFRFLVLVIAGSDGVVVWNMCDTNDMCKNSFFLYLWRRDMFTAFAPHDGVAAGWVGHM